MQQHLINIVKVREPLSSLSKQVPLQFETSSGQTVTTIANKIKVLRFVHFPSYVETSVTILLMQFVFIISQLHFLLL